MKFEHGALRFSATDLANHLSCPHLTQLELQAARGELAKPHRRDERIEALIERGKAHEKRYVESLGLPVAEGGSRADTERLLREGAPLIVQAHLGQGPWHGFADVLLRVDRCSALGDWSYVVVDTKLARETKAETLLQLCVYAELLAAVQDRMPEHVGVVTPLSLAPEWHRTDDALAYYRRTRASLLDAVEGADTAPEPVPHCDVCRWWPVCDRRWRDEDHLSLVAGITRPQRRELEGRGVATVQALANHTVDYRPRRGSAHSLAKTQNQARLQIASRGAERPLHELRECEAAEGLGRLPAPSAGDVFLDLEGDHFYGERGLEYLFGVATPEGVFHHRWAHGPAEEKTALEWFAALVEERRTRHPDLRIYHFGHYEPSALKRLVGEFATCEDTLDDWLRNHLFVDLHRVVKEAMLVGVERYSIKDLEPLFRYERDIPLPDAGKARRALEHALELGAADALDPTIAETVLGYNRDDCESTGRLRDWLESVRAGAIADGREIPRPALPEEKEEGRPAVLEHRQRVRDTAARLLDGVPTEGRTPDEEARWLVGHSLGYYSREAKAAAWERYRLKELTLEEYEHEKSAIAGLEFVEAVPHPKDVLHRFRFPSQECTIRDGDLTSAQHETIGSIVEFDVANRTLLVKRIKKRAHERPTHAYVPPKSLNHQALEESLMALANSLWPEAAASRERPSSAASDLLFLHAPRLTDGPFKTTSAELEEACELVRRLDRTVLPIQGPPGTGKTHLGARVIVDCVLRGLKVGVAANSHQVVRNLLAEMLRAAESDGVELMAGHKVSERSEEPLPWVETTDNDEARNVLNDLHVLGGMKFLWSREQFADSVDVLVVDEASQIALPDALAMARCCRSMILIGDPQQLDQPQQGSHPEGVGVSPLDHLLAGEKTVPPERGLFLPHTHRLHPDVCAYTSEMFYESRLGAQADTERQRLDGCGRFCGAGLHFMPVEHEGNQSTCPEEVEVVAALVAELLKGTWTDRYGATRPLKLDDILIVAPFNAQVGDLRAALPGARVGTVDKFQGQEAPVAIYSMTSSSAEDAPRGMEFLYNLNRLNVATSRARCAAIVVSSPALLDVACRTPRQIRLVNALCRFGEMATSRTSPRA